MLLLALVACGNINPVDGTYLGEVQDFSAEDACETVWGVDLVALQAANATDILVASDRESMTLDDSLACTLFDEAFNCLQTDEDRGASAYVETRVVVTGEFTSSYDLVSEWDLRATCEGDGCGELAEDCTINWTFAASYVGY
jgi:hypothetical protein